MRIFIVADGVSMEIGLLAIFQHFTDLVFRHQHCSASSSGVGSAAHLLQHLTGDTVELVDSLNHMYRYGWYAPDP